MGRLRKVLVGAVAALATLTAGLVGVTAANAAGAEQITLEPAGSGSLTATNYKAYKLVGYPSSVSTATSDVTDISGQKVSDAVENAIANALHAAGVKVSTNDPWGVAGGSNASAENDLLAATDSAALAQIAGTLAGDATGSPSPFTSAETVAGTQSGSNVLFSVDPGLYLIVDSSSSDPSLPIIVSSTLRGKAQNKFNGNDIGTAKVKSSSTYAPKKTYTDENGNGTEASEPYVAVGQIAKFKITMTIPAKTSYQSFKLEDTPSGYDILADTGHPMTITAGSGSAATTYTVTDKSTPHVLAASSSSASGALAATTLTWPAASGTGATAGGFVLEDNQFAGNATGKDASWRSTNLNVNSLLNKHSGETLTITYDARVTDPGAMNSVGSDLTDFSGKHHHEKGSTTKNGTVGEPLAQFTKVAAANRDTKLGGAKFTLTTGTGPATQYWTKSGETWSHSGTETKLTTGTDGTINLDGLTSGTYALTETDAPTGYMQTLTPGVNTTAITITIGNDGKVSVDAANPTASGLLTKDNGSSNPASPKTFKTSTTTNSDGVVTKYTIEPDAAGQAFLFSLGNLKNISELPATGGAGIIAGIILVALLLAIGGSFIAISRKMHKDRQQVEGVRA